MTQIRRWQYPQKAAAPLHGDDVSGADLFVEWFQQWPEPRSVKYPVRSPFPALQQSFSAELVPDVWIAPASYQAYTPARVTGY